MHLTEGIKARYDIRSDLYGTRFVIKQGDDYKVARLSKSGSHGGKRPLSYGVKVGATPYQDVAAAVRAIGGSLDGSSLSNDSVANLVDVWLGQNNGLAASSVHGDSFVFSRCRAKRGWLFHIAQIGKNGLVEAPQEWESVAEAFAVLVREHGNAVTHDLTGIERRRSGFGALQAIPSVIA